MINPAIYSLGDYVVFILTSFAYGSLLFLMASGFSLIFGLMKITNLTHVMFYMMGAYLGLRLMQGLWVGSLFQLPAMPFVLAMIIAAIIVTIIGLIVFWGFLFRLQHRPQAQVLLCLGFMFFFDDAMFMIFGGHPMSIPVPAMFRGGIFFLERAFPYYRLFLIAVGIVVAVLLWVLIEKTKIGCLVRSGVDDEETARAMGVNVNQLFFIVFGLGTFLAAVGGFLGSPWLGMEPRMGFTLLPFVLAVVIIGGLGSLKGAFFGSMVVGLLNTIGSAFFPDFAYVVLFLPMALVLVFKPNGLFVSGGTVEGV